MLKRGHAMAVVDGVLVDTWRPGGRSLVTGAWEVTSATTHHPSQLTALLITGMTQREAAVATGCPLAHVANVWDALPAKLRAH